MLFGEGTSLKTKLEAKWEKKKGAAEIYVGKGNNRKKRSQRKWGSVPNFYCVLFGPQPGKKREWGDSIKKRPKRARDVIPKKKQRAENGGGGERVRKKRTGNKPHAKIGGTGKQVPQIRLAGKRIDLALSRKTHRPMEVPTPGKVGKKVHTREGRKAGRGLAQSFRTQKKKSPRKGEGDGSSQTAMVGRLRGEGSAPPTWVRERKKRAKKSDATVTDWRPVRRACRKKGA